MQAFAQNLAIVIGINDYAGGIPRLTTAANDAARLAEVLSQQHGYDVTLLNRDVCGARLKTLFTEVLPGRVGADDRLLVYFAGHGITLPGDDGPAGYLVPQDALSDDPTKLIAMADLNTWLAGLPCRHMLAILDCCFAGAFRWTSTRDLQRAARKLTQQRYDRFTQSRAWQVIVSASYDQRAVDVLTGNVARVLGERKEDAGTHSPFARALFEGLAGSADLLPKGGGDGVITATELAVYLRDTVELEVAQRASLDQTPQLWPLKKHDRGEYVFLTPGRTLDLPAADPLTETKNPYRGLKAYEAEHHDLFFGRRGEIEALTRLLADHAFIAVLGASGTGKSSLVKAGLLPRLAGDGAEWCVLPPIRPTDHPLKALGDLVRNHLAPWAPDVEALHGPDVAALARIAGAWAAAHPDQRLVLTVDQCEELATLCRDPGERRHFVDLLAQAVAQHPTAFRLIVTLRTDFEPQLSEHPLFAALKHPSGEQTGQVGQAAGRQDAVRYVVPPMDQADLRDVIEGPAAERTLYFEPPELVDRLINEVLQTPGALPLLSFTLSEMYIRSVRSLREDRSLRTEDYEALGGVIGSLRGRADQEYEGLPDPEHQETMARVMLRMVAAESGGEIARRRVTRAELEYPSQAENDRVTDIVDRLVEARLLVKGKAEDETGEAYVEPAHDALLLAWDRLLQWKRAADEHLLLQRRLWQAASEWRAAPAPEKTGLLWSDDPRLPQLEGTLWPISAKGIRGRAQRTWRVLAPSPGAPAGDSWLNNRELTFVRESVRMRARGWRRTIAITSAVILVLSGLALYANVQRSAAVERQAQAERASRRSTAGELAAYTENALVTTPDDPSLALLLALEAVKTTWTKDKYAAANATRALHDAIQAAPPFLNALPPHRHTGPVNSATFSPDGRHVVTAGADQTVRIWDVATGRQALMLVGHREAVNRAEFNRDGTRVVTASDDGTARIWDAQTGAILTELAGHAGAVMSAAFDATGAYVVTAGTDRTARLWDAQTGREVHRLEGHTGELFEAAFSPDGGTIVTASWDGTARTWNAATGRQLHELSKQEAPVTTAFFTRDGQQVMTGGGDGAVRFWHAATGLETRALKACADAVTSALLDAPGRVLTITCGTLGELTNANRFVNVTRWDLETGRKLPALNGPHQVQTFADLAQDGRTLVTASRHSGTADLWDLSTGRHLRALGWHPAANFAALSHSGNLVATAGAGDTVEVWDIATRTVTLTLEGHLGPVTAAAFAPGEHLLVTGSFDKTARTWDLDTGREVRRFDHPGPVNSVAFDPSGGRMVTGGSDKIARMWDVTTGSELRQFAGHGAAVNAAAFDPSGQFIVTASSDQKVRLWEVASGQIVHEMDAQNGAVLSAGFSPDGKNLVTSGAGQTATVWDVATGKARLTLTGHGCGESNTCTVRSAAYSPDGSAIVTAGADRTVRVWGAVKGEPRGTFTGHTDKVTAAAFTPNGKTIVSAGDDGTVRFWSAAGAREWSQLITLPDTAWAADFSPDGKMIAAAGHDGTADIWRVETGEKLHTLNGHGCHKNTDVCRIAGIAFSPNGKTVATAGADGTARLWDADTGEERVRLTGHTDSLNAVRFSPDGRQVATASEDDTARLWDAASGRELLKLEGHGGRVNDVAFSPDGKTLLTASEEGWVGVWDLSTGERTGPLLDHGSPSRVNAVAFSQDGAMILSAASDVILWDRTTGRVVRQFAADGPIGALALSPDGRTLAAGGDAELRLWDLDSGTLLRIYGAQTPIITSVAFSHDGEMLASTDFGGQVRIMPSGIASLTAQAAARVQRDPAWLTPEERNQYGLTRETSE